MARMSALTGDEAYILSKKYTDNQVSGGVGG